MEKKGYNDLQAEKELLKSRYELDQRDEKGQKTVKTAFKKKWSPEQVGRVVV